MYVYVKKEITSFMVVFAFGAPWFLILKVSFSVLFKLAYWRIGEHVFKVKTENYNLVSCFSFREMLGGVFFFFKAPFKN